MVVAHLVSAASQSIIQSLGFDKSINHNCFSNLAKLLQLIGYFKDTVGGFHSQKEHNRDRDQDRN